MSKNFLQDVLPPERKSIRDIPLPEERRKRVIRSDIRKGEGQVVYSDEEDEKDVPAVYSGGNHTPRIVFWSIALAALIFLVFAFSSAFGGASIIVTPKTENVAVDLELKAYKDSESEALKYDEIVLSKQDSKKVKATGKAESNKKASGKIVIYNNEPYTQALIKNTRFETPQGLIFRIAEGIVVPSKTASAGSAGESKPGSLEVTVYADQEGSGYNIGLTDFTIPGFKGDPRFKTIYARSKTEMSGGSKGMVSVASEKDMEDAKKELRESLSMEIKAQAEKEIPENYILYEGAGYMEFESLPVKSESDLLEVTEKVTFRGIIFNEDALKKSIGEKEIENYSEKDINISDIKNLSFVSDSKLEDIKNQSEISFSLKGDIAILWRYDEEEIKNSVRGKSIGSMEEIMNKYDSINKTEVVLKPFWKKNVPSDVNKIKVIEKTI